jgi:hypothetical protein
MVPRVRYLYQTYKEVESGLLRWLLSRAEELDITDLNADASANLPQAVSNSISPPPPNTPA